MDVRRWPLSYLRRQSPARNIFRGPDLDQPIHQSTQAAVPDGYVTQRSPKPDPLLLEGQALGPQHDQPTMHFGSRRKVDEITSVGSDEDPIIDSGESQQARIAPAGLAKMGNVSGSDVKTGAALRQPR